MDSVLADELPLRFEVDLFQILLKTQFLGRCLTYRPGSVNSTMDLLDDQLKGGSPTGATILAESQSKGRGQECGDDRSRTREWVSRPTGNLYFSFLMRLVMNADYVSRLLLSIPCALVRSLRRACRRKNIWIKWPNDIIHVSGPGIDEDLFLDEFDGEDPMEVREVGIHDDEEKPETVLPPSLDSDVIIRKLCGILVLSSQMRQKVHLNIGIGINVLEHFDESTHPVLSSIATSCRDIVSSGVSGGGSSSTVRLSRERILADFFNALEELMGCSTKSVWAQYSDLSFLKPGTEIVVMPGKKEVEEGVYTATVVGFDLGGNLRVRVAGGEGEPEKEVSLLTGEVSIRLNG